MDQLNTKDFSQVTICIIWSPFTPHNGKLIFNIRPIKYMLKNLNHIPLVFSGKNFGNMDQDRPKLALEAPLLSNIEKGTLVVVSFLQYSLTMISSVISASFLCQALLWPLHLLELLVSV
ncbi:hypothetical protein PanWU01x14_066730 [Parasponia andersonii]|uniref:Uncharacterized protein n=1 Tax=Parasponia andersonii TaxID=3476 RepID=A0A2P5DG61_PARAD|nr:hypothetical protein PanWU01x14_066730 [Parasponia andersonii]